MKKLVAPFELLHDRWVRLRNKVVTRWLSFIYGQPVEVVARGHVALAGAVVLWYLQDGFKQFILLKQNEGDGRARFISCLGTGPHSDMGLALAAVLNSQLGEVFARTVEKRLFNADRVAAAPLFSYTDDGLGVTSPVQTLVWVVQVNPAAIDLIHTGKAAQVVIVAEFGLSSDKISPTHRALYQSIMRHLPKGKMAKTEMPAEEGVKILEPGVSRTVH